MNFKELEDKNIIVRVKVDFKQIYNLLSRSKKDLKTAKLNLNIYFLTINIIA